MNCENCKYSVPYEHNHEWNDVYQKAYDEEIAWNEALDKTNWYTYRPFPRHFWSDIKIAYDAEEAKKANYIICKCMPTFIERKKTDKCGQFVWSE